jgi:hypothetical protein
MRTVTANVRGYQVTMERPDPLVIWLDTSVVLNFSRLEQTGRSDPRFRKLFSAVQCAIVAGRAIVVAGAEEDEVYSENWKEFRQIHLALTRKRSFRNWMDVQRAEFGSALAAWTVGATKFRVPASAVYDDDTWRSEAEQPDIHASEITGNEQAMRRAWAESSRQTAAHIETLRQQCVTEKRTYRYQLENELRAGSDWPLRVLLRHAEAQAAIEDVGEATRTLVEYHDIAAVVGKTRPVDLSAFLASRAGTALPSAYVHSVLWTDMVTGTEPVEGGDAFDTQHLRLAVPFADIVFTDKRMANRIRSRKLDAQFSSSVYCINDLDELVFRLSDAG